MGLSNCRPTHRFLQQIGRQFLPRKIDPSQLIDSLFLEASLLTKMQQQATPIHSPSFRRLIGRGILIEESLFCWLNHSGISLPGIIISKMPFSCHFLEFGSA
ncbi:hypothetical protein V6Z11_1Z108200 [Gossypium hirsutum]